MSAHKCVSLVGLAAAIVAFGCSSPVGKPLSDYQLAPPDAFYAVPNAGAGSIALNWSESAEADSYIVYRSTKDGDYKELTTATGGSHIDSGLSASVDYYYMLVARGAENKRSVGVKAAMSLAGYPAPTGFRREDSGVNWVSLEWGAVHGAEGYRVFRSVDGTTYAEIGTSSSAEFGDTLLTSGSAYWYQVSAYGHGVEGKRSVALQVTPGDDDGGDEGAPTGLAVVARGGRSITLSWNAAGQGNYSIYRSTDGGRSFSNVGGAQSQTEWTDYGDWADSVLTPLSAGTSYWYKVSSWTEDGEWEEAFSSVISTATLPQFTGTAIDAGYGHAAAVQSGEVWTWGSNGSGQLGDGTTESRWLPTRVAGLSGVVAVSAGQAHTLALKSDGTVWAWGGNGFGAIGDGTFVDRHTPVQVPGLTGVVSVSAGNEFSLALKSDGTVWSWGNNGSGQLGDGTYSNRDTPVQVSALTNAAFIAAGDNHSLALLTDGTVRAWGANWYGQLGDGTTSNKTTPTAVSGLSSVDLIACGRYHSLAVRSDGSVWTWGYNYGGQLGDGLTTDRNTPFQVPGLSNAVSVSGGGGHSAAATGSGIVWTWGNGGAGQLGDGLNTDRFVPGMAASLSGVASVSCGEWGTYARKADGSLWAWGSSYLGQIGVGDTMEARVPTAVAQPE